jgi:serine/threonine protein kinase
MASEKELFVTKQYVPQGEPISQNDHNVIYRVKCMAEPGHPEGILKMYRKRNVKALYETLKRLDYSEWPHIYAVKYFDGNTLVVEEFLKGNTLEELLAKNRSQGITFSEAEAGRIMEQVCHSIEILLSANPPIVHHNLKPSNLFVTSTGRVKFLDFEPGTIKQKSPLQSFLHFLGAIFHEMLTGKPPKGKCTYKGRYEPVIRRCMEKDVTKQYTDIKDLKEDMEYAKTHEPENLEKVGIPYVLTFPFQGIILCFEWVLLSFFLFKDNTATTLLFAIILVLHGVLFAARRHSFLKKEGIILDNFHRFGPILILAAIMIVLYFLVTSFILPSTGF